MLKWIFKSALVSIIPFSLFAGERIKGQHIVVDWLAPQTFALNSETLIGIRFRPDPHWHVYWKNPGDSGAAPKFKITTAGAEVSDILWPYPERLPVAHLTNLGYAGETAYLLKVKPTGDTPVEITAQLEWLVCKEECVPGFGELTLKRSVAGDTSQFDKAVTARLAMNTAKLPLPVGESPFELQISEVDTAIKVSVTSGNTNLPQSVDLFPMSSDYVLPAKPVMQRTAAAVDFIFQTAPAGKKPEALGFLLVADGKSYEYTNLNLEEKSATTAPDETLWVLLLSALIGGVLLNLMPCVFPVLSIKAMSLVKTTDKTARRRDGLLYTLGVLVAFTALGALFLLLRNLGSALGWGFQLQSPLVVYSLIVLFWLMGLNFLGVFEFGDAIMNASGRLNWHSSFGTGILSVFVAAPCTGPFMGTALGATALLPSYQAMLIFLFLALGLALPYLLLTFIEPLGQLLPRPGAWMETLKQFLAFPLFATVLWLLWVLGHQKGTEGWGWASAALLLISFSLWLGRRKQRYWHLVAWIIAFASLVSAGKKIESAQLVTSPTSAKEAWQPYSDVKLREALQKGQSVFVDFTATWCITCQVNKKAVLDTDAGNEIFEKAGIVRLRADWTNQDAEVTEALARLGRSSVPVYAFYSKGNATPHILPQILTINMIEELTQTKENK